MEPITLVLAILVAYLLGKLHVQQRDATDTSRVALFASILAMTDAKALKNSTVINRIIEKYNPAPVTSTLSPQAQKMHDELEEILDASEELKVRAKKPAPQIDPEDLI